MELIGGFNKFKGLKSYKVSYKKVIFSGYRFGLIYNLSGGQIRFWIENSDDQYDFIFEYTEKCKLALDEAGIEIPYPHLQLFVEDTKGIRLLSKDAAPDSSGKN